MPASAAPLPYALKVIAVKVKVFPQALYGVGRVVVWRSDREGGLRRGEGVFVASRVVFVGENV